MLLHDYEWYISLLPNCPSAVSKCLCFPEAFKLVKFIFVVVYFSSELFNRSTNEFIIALIWTFLGIVVYIYFILFPAFLIITLLCWRFLPWMVSWGRSGHPHAVAKRAHWPRGGGPRFPPQLCLQARTQASPSFPWSLSLSLDQLSEVLPDMPSSRGRDMGINHCGLQSDGVAHTPRT